MTGDELTLKYSTLLADYCSFNISYQRETENQGSEAKMRRLQKSISIRSADHLSAADYHEDDLEDTTLPPGSEVDFDGTAKDGKRKLQTIGSIDQGQSFDEWSRFASAPEEFHHPERDQTELDKETNKESPKVDENHVPIGQDVEQEKSEKESPSLHPGEGESEPAVSASITKARQRWHDAFSKVCSRLGTVSLPDQLYRVSYLDVYLTGRKNVGLVQNKCPLPFSSACSLLKLNFV